MYVVSRTFTFEAGHRLVSHPGKCQNYHGHGYEATVTVGARELDLQGMVIDFAVLKSTVGEWIDRYLDHNMILNPADEGRKMIEEVTGRFPYIMPEGLDDPTAENLARLIWNITDMMLANSADDPFLRGRGVFVGAVMVQETKNCRAEWHGPDHDANRDIYRNELRGQL